MSISIKAIGGRRILSLHEERLDSACSVQFRDTIIDLLEADGQPLIVDLSAVGFMDSSGLGALFIAKKMVRQRSDSFVLTGLQPRVLVMLDLSRMNDLFEVFQSIEDALAKT